MTSQEIRQQLPYRWSPSGSEAFWLKEIALQLALMNEQPRIQVQPSEKQQQMDAAMRELQMYPNPAAQKGQIP